MTSLWNFYYASALGRVAQRVVQQSLRELWPNTRGMTVAGYGFAAPFLRPFQEGATRTLCLMPAQQGVARWPGDAPNVSALVSEGAWPIPTGFLDRLIIAHAVETETHIDALFDEVWRVLSPEGRVIVIAPNRSGIWARADSTPFGIGRTFSYGQLEATLNNHKLSPVSRAAALYMPPSERRFILRSSGAVERFGKRLDARRLAGVLMVEASKQVFAMPKNGAKDHARSRFSPIRAPAQQPVGASIGTQRQDLGESQKS